MAPRWWHHHSINDHHADEPRVIVDLLLVIKRSARITHKLSETLLFCAPLSGTPVELRVSGPIFIEAAWNLKLDHLRENLAPILTLVTVGVALSVSVIGAILHFGIGLELGLAPIFGAIISATDPVSALALFKKLGAPKKLTIIIEEAPEARAETYPTLEEAIRMHYREFGNQ